MAEGDDSEQIIAAHARRTPASDAPVTRHRLWQAPAGGIGAWEVINIIGCHWYLSLFSLYSSELYKT